MKKAKTFVGVERERERERATTLTNNNQAKKLALLSVLKTDIKYENIYCLSFCCEKHLICANFLENRRRMM